MFSPALGRAVRSTSSVSISTAPVCCISSARRPAVTLGAAKKPLSRPHQRRLSSSKASIPPNGENGSEEAGAAASKASARKLTGRSGKKKSVAAPVLNVPHVPPTDYLQKPEVKISSFFSLHRPISVTSAIPPISTNASFDSIFQSRNPNSRKIMMENIQTLSGGIESLEAALRGNEQKQAPEDILGADAQLLDGPPQVSIDQIMTRFLPFKPPPAPVPLSEQAAEPATVSQVNTEPTPSAKPTQKSWSTTVVVTESTDTSGQRTYSASTSPMVEINVPAAEDLEIRQPFLERMRTRQDKYARYRDSLGRPDMLAISVKRQRKLKMKKHKYKKLMKRTRLLRRKLDRL